jgi:hypothetical protein
MKIIRIFCLLVFLSITQSDDLYTLVLHSQERGAACLDGSPTGLYYHMGSGSNRNKYLLSFDGGGFCSGLTLAEAIESCYQRSFSRLGSTKDAPAKTSFIRNGLLSPDK